MVINYEFDVDLANPGETPRIQVKQGDVLSRCVYLNLLANGAEWMLDRTATAAVRYCVHAPDGQVISQGAYDKLEDDCPACTLVGNMLAFTLSSDMLAQPGLVTADVLLTKDMKQLATFNLEILVHPAPLGA